jgi:spermidine/putrescine transport system substrate-binding protein
VTFPVDPSMLRYGQPARGSTVKVLVRNDHINAGALPDTFTQQTGMNLSVSNFDTEKHALDKVTNANLDADVMIGVTKDCLSAMVLGGMVRPLDHARIPNLANLWGTFDTTAGSFWDVGMRYSVPYSVWSMGVAYDAKVTPTADAKDPWGLVWDPRVAGKVSILDDYRQTVTLALLKGGAVGTHALNTDYRSTRADALSSARAALDELTSVSSPTYGPPLSQTSTAVSQALSSDMLAASRTAAANGGDPSSIGFLVPPSGGEVGGDHMVLLQAGRNPAGGMALIDWLLDIDNAMLNFGWTGAQPPLARITDPQQLVAGSVTTIRGRYGDYGFVPGNLASAILTEERYTRGWFGDLELSPQVQAQWIAAAPAAVRP